MASVRKKTEKPAVDSAVYLDPGAPIERRVDDLVSRMTLKEKISQMIHTAPAIERLGIPEYDWWNECLHGVARAGYATVFPQAIGLGATWNVALLNRIAEAISDEARAKHHDFLKKNMHERYMGLTYWSPNINIFRDPRWGRGHETYGEDPFLTGRLGVAFVKGLQGDDPKYLKLVATPKHFAVHSGPERLRHGFDARVGARDLHETYLPAFKACVREAKAASVMSAYNRTNGEACSASFTLLQRILRDEWGFDGFVVSDCGAVDDVYRHHGIAATAAEAAAVSVKTGCDLNCGETYAMLSEAVEQGLIAEEDIDKALSRLFRARFMLGMFDPPTRVPYAKIPIDVVGCTEHRKLALQAARQSIVLLKNANGILPLDPARIGTIAVIGPAANDAACLMGNYNGNPSRPLTPLYGIMERLPRSAKVLYAAGSTIHANLPDAAVEARDIARQADVAVVFMGLSPGFEGEEGCSPFADDCGDRREIELYKPQDDVLRMVAATGTPTVLVLLNGGAVSVPWAAEHVPAIVEAWYPGELGGGAVADVLFGEYNPAGRLPVTIYRSVADLPPFEDYAMKGRTYRFFKGEPLYPFGFGLSYTRFSYSKLTIGPSTPQAGSTVRVSVDVENAGLREGDEVVQLYLQDVEAGVPIPLRHLEGFERVTLKPAERRTISFELKPVQFSIVKNDGMRVVEPGQFRVWVGGCQPGSEILARGCTQVVGGDIWLFGDEFEVE